MSDQKRIPTDEEKQVAKKMAKVFGGKPKVYDYFHDTMDLSVGMLSAADRPDEGITSYGTIGLLHTPLTWGEGEFPTRIELAGACRSEETQFPNVLSSAAFNIMRNGKVYYPGAVMPGYVREYYPDTTTPHLYFTAPFLWSDLTKLEVGGKTVTWLLAMPITDAEYIYLKEHGDEPFEQLLEAGKADIYDLCRSSVV